MTFKISKCPTCEKEGKKHSLLYQGSRTTLLGYLEYTDENGNWHCHNPNRITEGFSCSNGHWIAAEYIKSCPHCDYGKDSVKVKVSEIDRNSSLTTGQIQK